MSAPAVRLLPRLLPRNVRLGARAIALRLRLASMLRRRSLPDLLRAITPAPAATDPAPLASVEQALAAAERLAERARVVPDTCLYRALTRYAVLRSAGHPARFVMGVERVAPDIEGHAWIELHGEPYGETVDPSLVVTYSYPAPPRDARRGAL